MLIPRPGLSSVVLLVTAAGFLLAAVITAVTDDLTASLVYSLPGGCIAYAAEIAAKEYHLRCDVVAKLLAARREARHPVED